MRIAVDFEGGRDVIHYSSCPADTLGAGTGQFLYDGRIDPYPARHRHRGGPRPHHSKPPRLMLVSECRR